MDYDDLWHSDAPLRPRSRWRVVMIITIGCLGLLLLLWLIFLWSAYGRHWFPISRVTATPTSTSSAQAAIVNLKIQRATAGENVYVMTGAGIETVARGELLVVYAQDVAGFEADVAIV